MSTALVFWINGAAVALGEDPIPKTLRVDGCPYDNITVGDYALLQNKSLDVTRLNLVRGEPE